MVSERSRSTKEGIKGCLKKYNLQISLRGIDDFKSHKYLKIKNITLQLTLLLRKRTYR